ncbi:MAG: glycosyltransferase [Clostridia bacterium]|nr:glycosyltransferase [Clostridia bacterium]
MIKVLFVVENLKGGGAEKVLVNLVNNMSRDNFDITVLTLFSDGVNSKRLHSDVNYISAKKVLFKGMSHIFPYLPSRSLYKHYIGSDEYDIVIAYMTGIPTKVVSGAPYRKIAWLHSDFGKKDLPSLNSIGNINKIAECYGKYDAIAGVSRRVIDSFSKRIGIDDKLYLVYNTNETDVIFNKSRELASFPFEASSDPVIISVGKLEPVKGYDRLVRIASRLKYDGIDFKLCIAGEGKSRSNIENLIKEYSLEDRVFLLGFQENPYKYLSRSDIFVCSSYSEGLSTATTEALLLGLPIVSTDVSGAREILGENNEWGIVTGIDDDSLYEGLKRMLADKELRAHYAEATKERAPFFDKASTVKQAEDLFKEVMSVE